MRSDSHSFASMVLNSVSRTMEAKLRIVSGTGALDVLYQSCQYLQEAKKSFVCLTGPSAGVNLIKF